METKICGNCGIEKSIDEFGFRYPKVGIRHSWCKDCFVDYKRVWYSQNRERHLALVKSSTAVTLAGNQLVRGPGGDRQVRSTVRKLPHPQDCARTWTLRAQAHGAAHNASP